MVPPARTSPTAPTTTPRRACFPGALRAPDHAARYAAHPRPPDDASLSAAHADCGTMTGMPARRGQNPRDPSPPPERSVLKIPLPRAQSELQDRIDAGRELANTPVPSLDTDPRQAAAQISWGAATAQNHPDLAALRHRVSQWTDYNQTWIGRNLGGEAAEEYKSASLHFGGGSDDPLVRLRYLREDITSEISKLESTRDRLPLWLPEDDATSPAASKPQVTADAPIFIVHGSDTLRAEGVARTLERATGRQTVILREQANLGRTLIEKFEQHATQACYAIIILTPDDEGSRKDTTQRSPRARQNVIFEMGYFYGILGRNQVSVLLSPGVEKPSDIDGIAYINFDDNGAWKTELFRELEHAHIHINITRAG